MLTAFGKFSRKLRIDKGELLKDMAEKLQVTSSYLSSVEMGKRSVPRNWAEKLQEIYCLSEQEYVHLMNSIEVSKSEVTISLENKAFNDQEIILSFARKYDSLDTQAKEQLRKILR